MNVLGIFVKQPIPGQVKTRLGAELGHERAAGLYAAFISDLANRFRTIGDRRVLCYAPQGSAGSAYFSVIAAENYELWPQPTASLGERLAVFFDQHFSTGVERVVIVGSDSPTLPADFVQQAFELLEDHDCVLGPATDGGFYLVAQRFPAAEIFEGVEWSSSQVLTQTVSRIADCNANLALLPPWYDVDTLLDLNVLAGHIQALRLAGLPVDLPQTEPLMSNVLL